jgi:RimJ/RimL family protein N-acetyltransferase
MEIKAEDCRVYLKSLSPGDAEAIATLANDYDIAYNIAEWGKFPHPYTVPDALYFIDDARRNLMDGVAVHFGIRLASNSELIGVTGISKIEQRNKKAEVGYWIGKPFWKKGYATEAVSMLISYGFDELGLNKIHAVTFGFNKASAHLLEGIGFKKEGTIKENVMHKNGMEDDLLYGLLKSEFGKKMDIKINRG